MFELCRTWTTSSGACPETGRPARVEMRVPSKIGHEAPRPQQSRLRPATTPVNAFSGREDGTGRTAPRTSAVDARRVAAPLRGRCGSSRKIGFGSVNSSAAIETRFALAAREAMDRRLAALGQLQGGQDLAHPALPLLLCSRACWESPARRSRMARCDCSRRMRSAPAGSTSASCGLPRYAAPSSLRRRRGHDSQTESLIRDAGPRGVALH